MPPFITMPRGFETKPQAEAHRREVLRLLGDSDLGQVLNKCTQDEPCDLRMCPRCMRVTRVSLIQTGCPLLTEAAAEAGQELVAFSIVLTKEVTKERHGPPTLRLLHGRIAKQLQRLALPFPILISGLDVSLNEGLGQTPCWQPQLYGVTLADNKCALKEAFDNKTKHVAKPVWFREVDDLASALTYSAKTDFVRRVSYKDNTGRRNTRKVRLSRPQKLQLASWFGNTKSWETMIFLGIARRADKLVLLSSKKLSFSSNDKVSKFPLRTAVPG